MTEDERLEKIEKMKLILKDDDSRIVRFPKDANCYGCAIILQERKAMQTVTYKTDPGTEAGRFRFDMIEVRLYPADGPTVENPFPVYGIALVGRGDEKAVADAIANYTKQYGEPPARVTFTDPQKVWEELRAGGRWEMDDWTRRSMACWREGLGR